MAADWTTDVLVDGDRTNVVHGDGVGGVTGVSEDAGFSYTIDLGESFAIDGVTLFPRPNCCPDRLRDFRVSILNDDLSEAWGADLFQMKTQRLQ